MIKKTLFRTIATAAKTIVIEERDLLSSKYNKDSRGFITREQSEGVSRQILLNGNTSGKGILAKVKTGFLLKVGQGFTHQRWA